MIRRSLLSYQYRSLAPAPLASALPCSPAQRAYSSQPPSTNASPESITLPDGRKLSLARYGATNGYPVFYFHGFPGSRLEARVWADAASKFGANLISIDRPGIGLSTPQPRRTPLDFAKDVQHLAKQLDIPQWKILGVSGGGGAYSLACARLHSPTNLKGIAITCGHLWLDDIGSRGMNFGNKFIYFASRHMPGFLRWIVRLSVSRQFALSDEKLVELSMKQISSSSKVPAEEKKALGDGWLMSRLIPSAREHFRQGYDAFVDEGHVLTTSDPGFRLEEITLSPIVLWYARQDKNVPTAIGEAIAERVASKPELNVLDGIHLSFIVNHKERILEDLLAR